MRVLIVKISSLGDIIHTFPAVSDASLIPGITIDWVVEENFSAIAALHPGVTTIIPVALRRWRQAPFQLKTLKEFGHFIKNLRQQHYDLIIDPQGLLKSSLISLIARGVRWGYHRHTAREPITSVLYHKTCFVDKQYNALTRARHLLATSLGYPIPSSSARSGLTAVTPPDTKHVLFLPGTTWPSKKWPDLYWLNLAKILATNGVKVSLPWSNQEEYERAKKLQEASPNITIMEHMPIEQLALQLGHFKAVVSVDTGLGYLAAALNIPTIVIYGPTDPQKIATFQEAQINLSPTIACAPCQRRLCQNPEPAAVKPNCFLEITPERVWHYLNPLVG